MWRTAEGQSYQMFIMCIVDVAVYMTTTAIEMFISISFDYTSFDTIFVTGIHKLLWVEGIKHEEVNTLFLMSHVIPYFYPYIIYINGNKLSLALWFKGDGGSLGGVQ